MKKMLLVTLLLGFVFFLVACSADDKDRKVAGVSELSSGLCGEETLKTRYSWLNLNNVEEFRIKYDTYEPKEQSELYIQFCVSEGEEILKNLKEVK